MNESRRVCRSVPKVRDLLRLLGHARPSKDMGAGRNRPVSTMLFLFVEDDENVAAAFAELAASLGHHADVARTGGEALRMTGQTRYDSVFMDIGLPDIDGRKLCEYVRCAGASTEACIVAVTGKSGFDMESSRQFDGYLRKPVTALEVAEIIRRC